MNQPVLPQLLAVVEAARKFLNCTHSGDVSDAMEYLDLRDQLSAALDALPATDAADLVLCPRWLLEGYFHRLMGGDLTDARVRCVVADCLSIAPNGAGHG